MKERIVVTFKPDQPRGLFADFVELNALLNDDGEISMLDISQQITKGEEDEVDRVESDSLAPQCTDALEEIRRRLSALSRSEAYPFALKAEAIEKQELTPARKIYVFLTLATVLNMSTHDKMATDSGNLYGTRLFEQVCADVLAAHIPGAHVLPIGTGGAGGLAACVDDFCKRTLEGGGYANNLAHGEAGDGGVDLIGWVPTYDERTGVVMLFCSCKTGKTWFEKNNYMPRPGGWAKAFTLRQQLDSTPMTCAMVAEALDPASWKQSAVQYSYLIMDRVRLAHYAGAVRPELLELCWKWSMKASENVLKRPLDA